MKPAAIILFVLALTSCELVTQVDIPEPPLAAVVNSVFTTDTTWFINVSTSAHILSEFSRPIDDVQVFLSDETGLQIPVTEFNRFDSTGGFIVGGMLRGSFFRTSTNPQPGMTYHLEVKGSNIPTAHATARTPSYVPLVDVKVDSANAIEPGGDVNYRATPIEFTFDDPAGESDYYYPRLFAFYEFISILNGDTTRGVNPVYLPLVKEPTESGLFGIQREVDAIADELFDGKRKTVRLYIIDYSPDLQGPKPLATRFYLNHANYEYFQYTRSLELAERARGNPFAEPVQVYSNVDGGLGIFAGATVAYWEF